MPPETSPRDRGAASRLLVSALILGMLVSAGLSACGAHGQARHATQTDTAASTSSGRAAAAANADLPPLDNDDDNDDPAGTRYDGDDGAVLYFGHAADAAASRTIASVIRRYYVAGAARNGAVGCSLLYSVLAERAPEDVGDESSTAGNTCGQSLSGFFRHNHRMFADVSGFALILARVEGARGIAVVRFGSRERRVLVHREGQVWKVNTLTDIALP